jgi:hypothetical protein
VVNRQRLVHPQRTVEPPYTEIGRDHHHDGTKGASFEWHRCDNGHRRRWPRKNIQSREYGVAGACNLRWKRRIRFA